jgi:hypothetical protein
LIRESDWMLRIKLNELGKENDNGLIMAEVWRWDGIGWNECIPQQEEDFIRADDDLFVTIPAEAGLYQKAAGGAYRASGDRCQRAAGRHAASGSF